MTGQRRSRCDLKVAPVSDRCFLRSYNPIYTRPVPPPHTTSQKLSDALVWLFETIVCAAIFSAFAGCLFGEIIGDSGWRPVFTFISIWLLGALCATVDLRHRRRRRQVDTASD